MAEMKGIKLCGECINYDWKKHKCKIGCNDDSDAQSPFYGDCPLPDVVPKSEVDKLHEVIFMKEDLMQSIAKERNHYYDELQKTKQEVAREIFEEIDSILERLKKVVYKGEVVGDFEKPVFAMCYLSKYEELKKKYTEGESNGSKQ